MFVLKKNDIKCFPFEECSNLGSEELEEWAISHGLLNFNLWMLPQMLAYFGSFRVTKVGDQYDSLALLKDNISKEDLWCRGLWKVVTQLKRSSLVKSQIHPEFSHYSALVPLILAGLKKYKNIAYSAWTVEGLKHLVEPNLYEAMCYQVPDMSTEQLLEIRQTGLMNKTGPKMGQLKKATSTWKLTGLKHTLLESAPPLATTMLAQIWVAHPSVRSPYMILDPHNWDYMPDPLIDTEILTNRKPAKATDLPWE